MYVLSAWEYECGSRKSLEGCLYMYMYTLACSQQSIEGCLAYYVYSACKNRYGVIVAVTGRAACMYSILCL
jgi:hypothetical protein